MHFEWDSAKAAGNLRKHRVHVSVQTVGHTFAPNPPRPADAPEQLPAADTCPCEPVIEHFSDPNRQRDRANVAGFADQVHDGPVLFSLLDVVERQLHDFVPP